MSSTASMLLMLVKYAGRLFNLIFNANPMADGAHSVSEIQKLKFLSVLEEKLNQK